ncbi:MAG: methyl-accepting chemotaxis protein [Pirellulales bacterium]
MLPRSLPGRISLGFVALMLFSLLLGGVSLWRILDINRSVEVVSSNLLPSVVALNRVIQSNFTMMKVLRRGLLNADASAGTGAGDEAAFASATAVGDKASLEYESLLSDEEDGRLFSLAKTARQQFIARSDELLGRLREGAIDAARDTLRDGVDPALDACVAAFNDTIDYNITLTQRAATAAYHNVVASFWLIGGALAAAMLLGSLLGAVIIGTAKRSLGMLSTTLENGATQTSLASGQLATASQLLAEGCSEQGSAVAETSASLEEMSAMIRSTADNADKAKAFANQARSAAQTGVSTMGAMNEAMAAIEASSAEVAQIVKNIDEIAFQTNILALNAAVEAARAGEAGAGFAVVADEVRSLAQRSAAAAKQTAEKIEASIASSRRGSASCDRVGASLEEIMQKVMAADGLVAEIATAAKEQAQGIQQVGVAMTEMDKVTQSNSAGAEQSASAAEELKAQARTLQQTVKVLQALAGRRNGGPDDEQPEPASGPLVVPAAPRGRITRTRPSSSSLQEQIPMPREAAAAPDQEDRHFRNF